MLGAPFVIEVAQLDAVVGVRHADQLRIGRHTAQPVDVQLRALYEVVANHRERHDLPVVRQGRVESRQGVGDPAPFLDGHTAAVAAMQHIPHE